MKKNHITTNIKLNISEENRLKHFKKNNEVTKSNSYSVK